MDSDGTSWAEMAEAEYPILLAHGGTGGSDGHFPTDVVYSTVVPYIDLAAVSAEFAFPLDHPNCRFAHSKFEPPPPCFFGKIRFLLPHLIIRVHSS